MSENVYINDTYENNDQQFEFNDDNDALLDRYIPDSCWFPYFVWYDFFTQ